MTKNIQQVPLESLTSCPNVEAILTKHNIGYWKNPGGTDKQKCEDIGLPSDSHSYGPVYEKLLNKIKAKKNSYILEIGVQHGGSMLLWHDFCLNSFVIGVDIADQMHDKIKANMDDNRYAFLIENAYSELVADRIKTMAPNGIDLMIDDGPHSLKSQCDFIRLYVPLLSSTGTAVIEDIQEDSWFDRLEKELPSGYVSERVDRRKVNDRWDDLMLVIKRIS